MTVAATTVSVSEAMLLVVLVSGVVVETVTVLVCDPAAVVAGTVNATVIVLLIPAAIVPSEQLKL